MKIHAIAITMSLALLACNEPAPAPDEHADEHAHDESPTSTPSAWVEVRAPEDASLLELSARVVAASTSRARLDVPYRSTVVAVSVQAGDTVAIGDPLVELRVPELLQAAAILSGTSAQIGSQRDRKARLEDLRGKGLVGASDVFDVDTRIGSLSADRRLALASLKAAGVEGEGRSELLRRGTLILTSPVAGVVAELDAIPGDVVEPGESLAQVLGRGPARIEIVHSGALPDDVGLEFVGTEGSRFMLADTPISTAIEPGLGRTLAWYVPADGREIADGVRGRVWVRGKASELLEVPRRALRLHEGKAWVARRGDAGVVEVEVEVLRSSGSSALIRSAGLALGDQVAADVGTVLSIGRDPNAEGSGHVH
ncbi:efflux RND transporter periplasmic adaptor subunit [Nannocystaceae bacterium ST9]